MVLDLILSSKTVTESLKVALRNHEMEILLQVCFIM